MSDTVEVPNSGGGRTTFEKVDAYCPSCGLYSAWQEAGEGDYYQGPIAVCISCGTCQYAKGIRKAMGRPEPKEPAP